MGLFLGVEERFFRCGFGVALGVLDEARGLFLGAADGLGGDALAAGDPEGEHRAAVASATTAQIRYSTIGITRDVLSRDPSAQGRRRARGSAPRIQEVEEGSGRKRPALPCGEVDEPA